LVADRPVYPVSRVHLDALGGEFGIWQHAHGENPNVAFGYCTDDVARAFTVDLLHARQLGWKSVRSSAWRSLRFLSEAFDPETGRFRNFRATDGSWLAGDASEDSHGRALLALGGVPAETTEEGMVVQSRTLFVAALPAARRLVSPRAIASCVLGCTAVIAAGPSADREADAATLSTLEQLTSTLRRAFVGLTLDRDWPWPEEVLTYENALLPRALIAGGQVLGDREIVRMGLRVLDWLIEVQTMDDNRFSPIGNDGWWPCGSFRSRFDQQPIEATCMILAAEAGFHYTHYPRYLRAVESAYGWFLGSNDVGVRVADPLRGSCQDGLSADGPNANEGAESTLMWLTALEHVRGLRAEAAATASISPVLAVRAGRATLTEEGYW
jgi:hypothetical protein